MSKAPLDAVADRRAPDLSLRPGGDPMSHDPTGRAMNINGAVIYVEDTDTERPSC